MKIVRVTLGMLAIFLGFSVITCTSGWPAQDRDRARYSGAPISMNFQDVPVRSVLQLIAEISELNLVVSDTVDGNMTLRLTRVPWDQALDIVLEARQLAMERAGNVVWIAPPEELARRQQRMPLENRLFDVSYGDAADLAALIAGLLSERGAATVDARTNILLVTDTPARLAGIARLLADLDRPVRQVLIESRIVIARHDFNHQLGVRFGVTATRESGGRIISTAGSLEALSEAGRGRRGEGLEPPSLGDRLNVNLPTTSAPAGRMAWSILAADYLLDLELSALESEGRGEVISTPRVITASQTEAFIQQGVEIPYEQATSSGATSVQFKEAVLELRVVPLVTPDGRVQLDLKVKQDTVGEIFETGRGGTVPSIDTRELNTKVLLEDGQTVVLGGIFQEERASTHSKVPMLGDVPLLGALFRRRARSEQKRELLIFVTPRILEDGMEVGSERVLDF